MNVIIPMAGESKIFKEASLAYSKNFVEINHKPLFQRVFEGVSELEADSFIFIVNNEDAQKFHIGKSLKLLVPNCRVVVSEGTTAGAACSVLLAAEFIDNDSELVISNGDQILEMDLQGVIENFRAKNFDGGIVTFESVHPRWSFVRLDEHGLVVETSEKDPISKNATAGFYYFKHGADFVAAAKAMIMKDASQAKLSSYRQTLQREYVNGLISRIDNSKVRPYVLQALKQLQRQLAGATTAHALALKDTIDRALVIK